MSVIVIGATRAYFSDQETVAGNTFIAGTIDLETSGLPQTLTDIKPCEDLTPVTITLRNVGQNPGNLTFDYSYVEEDKEEDDNPSSFEYAANAEDEGHNKQPATGIPGLEMTDDQFARLIYVESSSQDGCDNLSNLVSWFDTMYGNRDGEVSLYELTQVGPATWYDMKDGDACIITYPTDDEFNAGQTSEITIKFHMAHVFTDETDTCSGAGAAYTGNMNDYLVDGKYCIYTGSDVAWNVPQADGINMTFTAELKQLMSD